MQNKKHGLKKSCLRCNGFSLTEVVITTAIVGTLSTIAYPTYIDSSNKAALANVQAKLVSIPPIISAFIDETGEAPTTWQDLSSIAVVMTENGPATGNLDTTISIPKSNYGIEVRGPTESIYTLTATPLIEKAKESDELASDTSSSEDIIAVKSCFNIKNGASDLRSGNLSEIENTLNCG
jgi:prepilin-type N-terminal cleavage/methylation domain-containing protein